jgi:hypothetical protein
MEAMISQEMYYDLVNAHHEAWQASGALLSREPLEDTLHMPHGPTATYSFKQKEI